MSNKSNLAILSKTLPFKRLGLGTVQFGADYGITNANGQVHKTTVKKILEMASTYEISLIDTACSYGDSETIIGQSQPKNNNFKIITKTSASNIPSISPDFCKKVELDFETSLSNLKVNRTYGLLAHNVADILKPGGEQLVKTLISLRTNGCTEKVGVSIYTERDIDAVLRIFLPDIIQIPLNILDQRLIQSGKIDILKKRGVEIHARSLFLQGTLLTGSKNLPRSFRSALPYYRAVEKTAKSVALSPIELCLKFGLQTDVDFLILGVTSSKELTEIINSIANLENKLPIDFTGLAIEEEQFLNPTLWQQKLNN